MNEQLELATGERSSEREPLTSIALPSVELPQGYSYGVTRAADLILQGSQSRRFEDLLAVLEAARFKVADMVEGGGKRSNISRDWDEGLRKLGWGKRNVSVERIVDARFVSSTRSHEIDMFGLKIDDETPYPGVACEMEWSNKDPFFDRDLSNFDVLHLEGIIEVGVVVTRGPALQTAIRRTIPGKYKAEQRKYLLKYGPSTTHWHQLVRRVERGGGGSCPLLLIGIEPARFDNDEQLLAAAKWADELFEKGDLDEINAFHAWIAEGGIS